MLDAADALSQRKHLPIDDDDADRRFDVLVLEILDSLLVVVVMAAARCGTGLDN